MIVTLHPKQNRDASVVLPLVNVLRPARSPVKTFVVVHLVTFRLILITCKCLAPVPKVLSPMQNTFLASNKLVYLQCDIVFGGEMSCI